MTNKEAIEILREMRNRYQKSFISTPENTESRSIFERYFKSCNKAIEALKKEEEQRWIPCSERLPEESGYYLANVCDYERNMYYEDVIWFAHKEDYDIEESEWRELCYMERVTAWMPLPEPYKGEWT